jgi:hypothetical protein
MPSSYILAATAVELTVKGLAALCLGLFALAIVTMRLKQPHHTDYCIKSTSQISVLEHRNRHPRQTLRTMSVLLMISICLGGVIAVLSSAALASLATLVLERLT